MAPLLMTARLPTGTALRVPPQLSSRRSAGRTPSQICRTRRTGTLLKQRRGATLVRAGGFVDPDEQKRIEDNKRWKRTDPAEQVWDIEEQRAASSYKKEALEAMFRLDVANRPDPLKPGPEVYLCGECGNVVATSEDAAVVAGKHKHTLKGGLGPVEVALFYEAEGALDASTAELQAPEWEDTSQEALGCCCAKCKAHLGWSYRAGMGDSGDFKAIQLNRVKLQ